jgi:glycosyltransferase involved in cell wall biosynthesis
MSVARLHEVLLDVRIVREPLTGVGRYLVNVLAELKKLARESVRVVGLVRQGQTLNAEIPLRTLSGRAARASPLSLSQQWLLPKALARERYDLYHYTNFDLPRIVRGPVVATCYDLEPLRHPELFTRRIVWFYRLFSRGLRRADHIITISNNTSQDVQRLLGIPSNRLTAIPLGVDARFRPVTDVARRAEVRAKHGLSDRFVLYVGNTMPHKNLGRVVEAMRKVRCRVRGVRLVLAGAPDKYRGDVQQAISACGLEEAVAFPGRIPESDLPALLSMAAVFVYPSLYEGFGLPVVEAMACGTPVVTSNRASLPEVVGEAAITVDPLDVDAIAAAIERILEDEGESRRLRDQGLERAQQFTWERCARAHLRVYEELLGQ